MEGISSSSLNRCDYISGVERWADGGEEAGVDSG